AWISPCTCSPVGTSALGFFFVLCWLYVFPIYCLPSLPGKKEIVAWRRDPHAGHAFIVNTAIAKPCSFKPWLLAAWGILCWEVLPGSD
uniref:Uncharacterized protein n=1 Tax=Anolis carolinensis TaxID=28377 RepID=A0A803SZV6_ANOCA